MAQPSLKRSLSEIQADCEELETRVKRLKTELEEHPACVERRQLEKDHAVLKEKLPAFLYDALVAFPSALQAEKYGTLRKFEICHPTTIYQRTWGFDLTFEKATVAYTQGAPQTKQIRVDFPVEHDDTPITQQRLWDKAVCINDGDVAAALVVVLVDAVRLTYDALRYPFAMLKEVEIYRRVQAKLPRVTPVELAEIYAQPMSLKYAHPRKDEIEGNIEAWTEKVNRTGKIYADA